MKKILLSVLAAALSLPAVADEGMWLLPLLQQQKFPEMQALGLKLQDYDIYSPDSASLKDAVVIFGGGCTGEIVSPERPVADKPSLRIRPDTTAQYAGA